MARHRLASADQFARADSPSPYAVGRPRAKLQTAIVHAADVLVKGLACGNPGDDLVPPLSGPAWDLVGLDAQSLTQCLAQATEEFQTIDDYL